MKPEWRRFAPFGLYLAGLAALVSLGLYIVQREFNLPLQISLAVIVVGIALFIILDPEKVRVALKGRQARYGSNALLMSVAFIGLVVVINYMVFKNPQRWDLTENQQYTLAPETLDTLQSLPQTVKAIAFYTPRLSTDQAQGLLDQYKFHADENFDYEFINPEADPLAANQANITRDGTIVFFMGDKQEQVTLVSERELTAGLVRLISTGTRTVYFITGHGEYNPEDTGEESYSLVKTTLEMKNYTVQTLNLFAENEIPDDAEVIVIAGPLKPVSEEEVNLLADFVAGGGSIIVMEEPIPVTEFGDDSDPLADYLEENWGIILGRDMVVDLTSNQPFVAVADQYGDHVITQKMQGLVTFYPTARSVSTSGTVLSASNVNLVLTADQSWAESDLETMIASAAGGEAPQINPDEGIDILGPVPLALAAENPVASGGRVVVFGDSDFASDAFFTQYGNGDLLINSIDWAAEQEALINLTPKDSTQRLLIPPQPYAMNLIFLGVVFILPGGVLLAGVVVWIKKRRRG